MFCLYLGMRWILTTIFIGFLLSSFAQEKRLEGVVNSGSYLAPLGKVYLKMGRYSAKTDYEGKFSIHYTENQPLVLSHSNYNTQKIPFENLSSESNLTVYLTPTSGMNSMVHEGSGVQSVYENEFEHVFDYSFLNDTLIVLSYMDLGKPNNPDKTPYKNCALTALRYGEIVDRKVIPDNIYRVFDYPDGGLFLEAKDTSYILTRTPEKLSVTGFDFQGYKNFISLAYAATPDAVFFTYKYPFLPMLAHKMYSHSAKETYVIQTVENREYTEKVSNDFAMLNKQEIEAAKKLETTTGVNYQMFSPYLRSFYVYRNLTLPYAPGFKVNAEIIIFDHINNMAYFYDSNGIFIRSIGMYHNNLAREKLVKMIQDPFTESLYTLHDKAGVFYLRTVDSKTGASGRPFKLNYPFAEKVKVFENYVYYLHKSAINEKLKHLVREELPFAPEQNSVDSYFEPDE